MRERVRYLAGVRSQEYQSKLWSLTRRDPSTQLWPHGLSAMDLTDASAMTEALGHGLPTAPSAADDAGQAVEAIMHVMFMIIEMYACRAERKTTLLHSRGPLTLRLHAIGAQACARLLCQIPRAPRQQSRGRARCLLLRHRAAFASLLFDCSAQVAGRPSCPASRGVRTCATRRRPPRLPVWLPLSAFTSPPPCATQLR